MKLVPSPVSAESKHVGVCKFCNLIYCLCKALKHTSNALHLKDATDKMSGSLLVNNSLSIYGVSLSYYVT